MIKQVLRGAGVVLGGSVALAATLALYVQITGIPRYAKPDLDARVVTLTPERVAQGKKLAGLMCAGCHENQETHRFTGRQLSELPPEFGRIFSKNITQHPTKGIGAWKDGELRHFLRTGVMPDGRYVPPYMIKLPHTSDADLDAIIAFLRSDDPRVAGADVDPPGVTEPSFIMKALTHVVFKPLPSPKRALVAPPKADAVAYGRYLVFSLDCYGCHSADFMTVNVLEPEKTPGFMGGGNAFEVTGGESLHSANLTADRDTGIGRWTAKDFDRALREGFRPDGRVLHYPMEPRPELSGEDTAAIFAYLRHVPAVAHAVPRPTTPTAAPTTESSAGKAAYARYGCASCHGESGAGAVGDLRNANARYPSDGELRRWIDQAPSIAPNTRMPGFAGVIQAGDYAPLIAHVRQLSLAKAESRGKLVRAP